MEIIYILWGDRMRKTKYCCYNIKHGCYFEFQKGDYFTEEKHWLESSLFIDDDIVNALNLGALFGEAIPNFNYYGPTKVTKEQWLAVKKMSENMTLQIKDAINEIDEWVQNCFLTDNCFSICGI